jgi:thiol-disulfide isomerase/thioredoxin
MLAQNEAAAIKVGGILNDVTLDSITNWHSQTAKLSDFKGKSIILDFWASWCGSCIAALPKLNRLQDKYHDRLQILVVTSDKLNVIKEARQRLSILKNNKLPIVYADTILNKLFPHSRIPHEVWIDKFGNVKAITGDDYVIDENIDRLLDGNELSIPQKIDFLKFEQSRSLIENLKIADRQPLKMYNSVFTSHLSGAPTMQGVKENEGGITRYYINQNILALYSEVIEQTYWNKLLVEIKDTGRLFKTFSNTKDWEADNLFCYELTVPLGTPESEIRNLMHRDLNKYFKLKINIESRKVTCWQISISDPARFNKLPGKKGKSFSDDGTTTKLREVTLRDVVNLLNTSYGLASKAPIFIEGDPYPGLISCDIPYDLLPAVNANTDELLKYLCESGFNVRQTVRNHKIAVLQDDL